MMQLRRHQNHAVSAFANRTTNASSIIMACGTGKSLIMDTICRQFKKSVLVFRSIDLLRSFYKDYTKQYKCSNKTLLIACSERISTVITHTTKKAIIEEFVSRPQFMLLITYKSYTDCLLKIQPPHPYDCIAFDEAHHVKIEHITKISSREYLFMTATPSKFLLANSQVVYQYSMNQAIVDRVICDHELHIVPYSFDESAKYVHDEYLHSISKPCISLIHFLKILKIISYHRRAISKNTGRDKTSSAEFHKLKELFNCIGCKQYIIDGTTNAESRADALEQFESDKCAIIHNCCSFGEGVNSPYIDCAILMDTKYSATSIIQAIGRTSRYNGKHKISRIFIPVNMHGCQSDMEAIEKGRWAGVYSVLCALANIDERVTKLCKGELSPDTKTIIKYDLPNEIPTIFGPSSPEIAKLFGRRIEEPAKTCKSRPNQTSSREQALEYYGNKCVISDEDYTDVLQAAHIKPYAVCKEENLTDEEANNPSNLIPLRADIHVSFDKFDFTFNENGCIEYDQTNVKVHKYLMRICKDINRPLLNFVDNKYFEWRRNAYRQKQKKSLIL